MSQSLQIKAYPGRSLCLAFWEGYLSLLFKPLHLWLLLCVNRKLIQQLTSVWYCPTLIYSPRNFLKGKSHGHSSLLPAALEENLNLASCPRPHPNISPCSNRIVNLHSSNKPGCHSSPCDCTKHSGPFVHLKWDVNSLLLSVSTYTVSSSLLLPEFI